MRRHERFDTQIPIQFKRSDIKPELPSNLVNISLGGLSFSLPDPITIGDEVNIIINHVKPPVELIGKVRWCRKYSELYDVGLEFNNLKDPFLNRMLKQICEIEKYRLTQLNEFNRDISSELAAKEWIEKYAAEFE